MLPSTVAALLLTLALAGSDTVVWTESVEAALELAREESRPIFIAINMDGERANDEMVRVHYRDGQIRKLTGHTVNLFASRSDHGSGTRPCPRAGTISCAQHILIEKQVRNLFLEGAARQTVIAPQHLFVGDEGNLLHSVPYRISVGELEWCLVRALKQINPDFSWKLSSSARAPYRLVLKGLAEADEESLVFAPSRDELTQILVELKKTGRGMVGPESVTQVSRLLLSEDRRATEYVAAMLKSQFFSSYNSRRLELILHGIGQTSPPVWWRVAAPFLSDHRMKVRSEAAVTLEQLADPASLGALLKQWRKEKDLPCQKELIRAIARVGADSTKAAGLVLKQAEQAKRTELRACALIAAAALNDRQQVLGLAEQALLDEQAELRAAAAYVIAVHREDSLRGLLEQRTLLENDSKAKALMETALRVLDGMESSHLDSALQALTRSKIPRDRR